MADALWVVAVVTLLNVIFQNASLPLKKMADCAIEMSGKLGARHSVESHFVGTTFGRIRLLVGRWRIASPETSLVAYMRRSVQSKCRKQYCIVKKHSAKVSSNIADSEQSSHSPGSSRQTSWKIIKQKESPSHYTIQLTIINNGMKL